MPGWAGATASSARARPSAQLPWLRSNVTVAIGKSSLNTLLAPATHLRHPTGAPTRGAPRRPDATLIRGKSSEIEYLNPTASSTSGDEVLQAGQTLKQPGRSRRHIRKQS